MLGMLQQAGQGGNILAQFQQFAQQMQGKDPKAVLDQLIATGQVNQQQLEQAQEKARQIMAAMGNK